MVSAGLRRINGLIDAKTYCQLILKGDRLAQFMLAEFSAVCAYNPCLRVDTQLTCYMRQKAGWRSFVGGHRVAGVAQITQLNGEA
jgi:hypothetical protein